MNLFFKGILLGIAIAAPVGPIGLLCMRKTLNYGRFAGLASGLGAAFADAIYGCIAAFGLTAIADFLLGYHFLFRVVGGIFLGYMGWETFFSKPKDMKIPKLHAATLVRHFLETFGLTMANPMTILAFFAIFASLGIVHSGQSYLSSSVIVIGVFCGSAGWWLLLCEGLTLFRRHMTPKVMQMINRIAGLLIAGFGLAILLSNLWM